MRTLIFLLMVSTLAARAQDNQYTFDDITLRGTGCKEGTTSVVKDPSSQSVSIMFDDFQAEVPQYDNDNDNDSDDREGRMGRNDVRIAHKRCLIDVKGKIPVDEKVVSVDVVLHFRGTTIAQSGSGAMFRSELLEWRGPRMPNMGRQAKIIENKMWNGDADENWTIEKNISIPIQSNCAMRGEREFRFGLVNVLRAHILPRVAPEQTSSQIFMDTVDMGANMEVVIKTQSCRGGPIRGGVTHIPHPRRPGGVRPPRPPRRPPVCRPMPGRACGPGHGPGGPVIVGPGRPGHPPGRPPMPPGGPRPPRRW